MIFKRLIFVGMVSLLAACSSSGGGTSDGGGTSGGGTTGGGSTDGTGTTDGGTTGGDAVGNQGVWVGDIGYGNGVFVVDGGDNFYGLSSANGSTYNSSFANIGSASTFSGALTDYFHPGSGANSGVAMAPIGEDFTGAGIALNLNVVTGQTIENSGANPFVLTYNPGSLTAATPSSVAGNWRGTHSFPTGDDSYAEYRMDVTFNGDTLSGSTGVYSFGGANDGNVDFQHSLNGTIAGFSSVLSTSFDWADDNGLTSYNGVIYFDPNGSGNLMVNVQAANGGEPVTLNSVLVRQ